MEKIEERAKQNNSSREEKREEIYQKLEEKIKTIIRLKEFAEEFPPIGVKELQERCTEEFMRVKNKFSPEVLIEFAERKKLLEEKAFLFTEITNYLRGATKAISKKDQEKEAEKEKRCDQLAELSYEIISRGSKDVIFLERVENFLANIVEKRKETLVLEEEFQRNPSEFLEKLEELGLKGLNEKNSTVQFTRFSVNIIIAKDFWEGKPKLRESVGKHFRNTVVNIIKDRSPLENKDTIEHEENHNLSESFMENGIEGKRMLQGIYRSLKKIKGLEEKGAPNFIIQGPKEIFKKDLTHYFTEIYNEAIADIDRIPRGEISAFFLHCQRQIRAIDKEIGRIKDVSIRETLTVQVEELKDNFATYLKRLGSVMFAADKIGRSKEAQGALILFRPREIRKIENYLNKKDGRFKVFQRLQPLISSENYFKNITRAQNKKDWETKIFEIMQERTKKRTSQDDLVRRTIKESEPISFFSYQNVLGLKKALFRKSPEIPLLLEDKEKENLKNNLKKLIPEVKEIFKRNSSLFEGENFFEYLANLREIAQNIESKELKDFNEEIGDHFLDLVLGEAINDNDFKRMEEILKTGFFSEERIVQWLEQSLKEKKIIRYYKFLKGEKINSKNITGTPFFSFLIRVGLAEKVKRNIKKINQ